MAHRVEIGEIVENAAGLNITGASVTVKYHGGANAPVYDAENGGALITQPLTTVNGKIGADYPSGAWVAEDTDYDLLVTFGSDTLTFFWPSMRAPQFVTSLPAGAGTSAPEDAELAIQLYDGTNKAAWLRRYRAATSDWDMIGGPPPAGGSLPGTPIARQEFYLTGGTPAVQHQRYNGSAWEYVGTPPTVPVTGSPLSILETGQSGQKRAGRELAIADFTTLCALPTTPVLLANLSTLTSNLGSGGALVNKGTVINGNGIDGQGNTSAQFAGAVAQALYTLDTGAADPYRIKNGSWGCWFRTARAGVVQTLVSKFGSAGTTAALNFRLYIDNNVINAQISDGAVSAVLVGVGYVTDDKWHFAFATHDGTRLRLFLDGAFEGAIDFTSPIQGTAAPFNIGGYGADAGTNAAEPHFGRIDEAFVTTDVLTEKQGRLIYAAKIPHGYSGTPTRAQLAIRVKRRGAALVSGDFPSQPVRLHSFVAGVLTDAGSGNVTLTNNNAAVTVAGPDGTKDDAFNFVAASSQSLSATDTGLPATTASRSYGCWFKSSLTGAGPYIIMAWGTNGTNNAIAYIAGGALNADSGANNILGPFVADGNWHFLTVTEENSGGLFVIDGLKRRLYVDGRLVGGSTVLTSLTLVGANAFRIGASSAGAQFFHGQISRAFVFAGVLTPEQIHTLHHKSSQSLTPNPTDPYMVEGFDATNVYMANDHVETNHTIELAVAA